jgi:tripartite-type tricarboxylate transporter receptor subunit TctC
MKNSKIGVTMLLCLIPVLSLLPLAGNSSAAEKFPSREVTITVSQAAGGSSDLTTRLIAEYLKKELGVPVIVENNTDAGGAKGIMDIYRAKPDGYRLLANLMPRNAQTEVVYKVPYKILDFTYLAAFLKQYQFVTVSKDSPYKTLKDLVDASKKRALNCSITGMGSLSHLDAILLDKKLGIRLDVVPFKGGAPAMMALLGGNVDLTTVEDFQVLLQREKVRPLAIFSEERSSRFPDVPTLKELGYNVPPTSAVLGISGPPGMPDEIRRILTDSLTKIIKSPEFSKKIEEMGPTCIFMLGPEFRALSESFYKMIEEYKDLLVEK